MKKIRGTIKTKMETIIDELLKKADIKYKQFHSSLCPNTNNIIGVRIPILREMAKKIAKEKPQEFLKQIDTKYYETVMLYGMVIGYMKSDIETRERYLDIFVPEINNWAVCDCCASTYKFTNKNLKEMFQYLQKYIRSNQEFEIRFAVIMLMYYYITDEYIDEVLDILNNVKHEGYYVKMGVAWAISMIFIKYEDKTTKFLNNNQLDKFTYNKSIQKIIESNRISKDKKEKLKQMKK